jgi:SOS response regulatory protein OraA/RecX
VARARVESGRARGLSRRRIALKLRGVDRDVADDAFAAVDAEHDDDGAPVDAEFAAAVVFATKKKLLQKEPQKALASLARQGFSFDVAKRALSSLRERDG